jgi:hypothetical protein
MATLAAIAYPTDDEVNVVEVAEQVNQQQQLTVTAPAEVTSDLEWIASDEDPFASKSWQAPPPAPEPSKQPSPVAIAPVDTTPAPPPPLPYKFVGQMNDGAQRVVYLSRGEQVLLAHQGDVLDGSYKVIAIGTTQVEFEAVSSGVRQMLPIPVQD